MPTGMLPMLDATDPNDRAFELATICVCVVSIGYLVHKPCIVTRMVELRVIIIAFFSFNDIDLSRTVWAACGMLRRRGGGAMAAVRQRRPPWSKGAWFS